MTRDPDHDAIVANMRRRAYHRQTPPTSYAALLREAMEALEPFERSFNDRRVGYAARYSDKDLGLANFDKMPGHWPMNECVFTMQDLRRARAVRDEIKEALK